MTLFYSNSRPVATSLGGQQYGGAMTGGSKVGKFFRDTGKYLRNTRVISRAAKALEEEGIAPEWTGKVARVAYKLGAGRKRRSGSKSGRKRGGTVMGINGGSKRKPGRPRRR